MICKTQVFQLFQLFQFFLMIQEPNLSFLLLYNYLYINYIYNNKGRKLSFLICL